jgi:hypothetical protein
MRFLDPRRDSSISRCVCSNCLWPSLICSCAWSSARRAKYSEANVASARITEERYDFAVALIQIHLEVQVRVLVKMVAEAAPSALLGDVPAYVVNG